MTVKLSGIWKAFDKTPVLRGIDLAVEPGSITALVGSSGSGKSTLLNIIAGLVPPCAGEVMIGGIDVTAHATCDRQIGYLFQNYALFPHLNVRDNVAFGLRVRGIARRERASRAAAALARVRLETFADRSVQSLSGGQRQRVALARALATEPQILLLDEPLSALDPVLRDDIRAELRELLDPLEVTTLIVTHDKADAFALAERIVMLSQGQVVQSGKPRDLYDAPQTLEVAAFFGTVNCLPGCSRTEDEMTIRSGLMFRPEDIERVLPPHCPDFTIKVQHVIYLGDRQRVIGKTDDGARIVADLAKNELVIEGALLPLRVRSSHAAGSKPDIFRVSQHFAGCA